MNSQQGIKLQTELTEKERAAIAEILEDIAKNGLPFPRDLDVALDAIQCIIFDKNK